MIEPELLQNLLKPKHIPASNKKRFGDKHDGGYVLYEPIIAKSTELLSFGCNNLTSFEEDILSYNNNIFVNIYDIEGPCSLAEQNDRVCFYTQKITSIDDIQVKSSNTIIQMDIEGSEFYVFNNSLPLNFVQNVSQFVIEIHFPFDVSDQDKIKLFENINKNFDLIHIHANNNASPDYIGPIPAVIECTYLNKDISSPLNLTEETDSFPIAGLDYPNHNSFKDYDLSWWCKK